MRNRVKSLIKRIVWSIVSKNKKEYPLSTPYKFVVKSCPKGTDITYEKYLGKYNILINNAKFIETQVVHLGYENDTVPVIQKFLKPGDVSIDFGANAGLISIVMADSVGEKGRVYSVEPGPDFFNRLRNNVKNNSTIQNSITLINKGVSNKNGVMCWKEDKNQPGNAYLSENGNVKVPVTTLDDIVKEYSINKLNFIKIDIEGMEWEAFEGGKISIEKFKPIILFETLPSTPGKKGFLPIKKILNFVKPIGYILYKINYDGSFEITDEKDLTHNSLIIHKSFNL